MTTISKESNIESLGAYIEEHIATSWLPLLEDHRVMLEQKFQTIGDEAYGIYLDLLFKAIHEQLAACDFRVHPKLPGNFSISREWGNKEENDQQRWMWSTVRSSIYNDIGTVVVKVFHDHTAFRIPRKPAIITLSVSKKTDIVRALSGLSPSFKEAAEAKVEIAKYLASQTNNKRHDSGY
jgi:hypothetical protein